MKKMMIIPCGYDARTIAPWPDSEWPQGRIADFLIATSIVRPLSTDANVWGSLVDNSDQFSFLEKPTWTGPVQHLWEDVNALLLCLAKAGLHEGKNYCIIMISLISFSLETTNSWFEIHTGHAECMPLLIIPPEHPEMFLLRGYDVSNAFLLSGLMNWSIGEARYRDKEAEMLARWKTGLNQYHLFSNVEDAYRCSKEMNSSSLFHRHAPFFVYAIHESVLPMSVPAQ